MNPCCYLCTSPASKVCKHPECSIPPFYCSGPCYKRLKLGQKEHTHKNVTDFVTYEEYENKIRSIRLKLDSHSFHRDYLEKIRKIAKIAKDHLQSQINSFDQVLHKLERDLQQNLRFELTEESQELMKKVSANSNGKAITGKNVNMLFGNKDLFMGEKKTLAAIKQIEEDFQKQLSKIMNFNVDELFISYNQRVTKSQILVDQGDAYANQEQYKEAIKKFKEARELNNFDCWIHFQIGFCLFQLEEFDEAQQSYKSSLRLDIGSFQTYSFIGLIHKRRENFHEAVKWYARVIKLNSQEAELFCSRAECYIELKKYEEALNDYLNALKLEPESKEAIGEKVQEIWRLGKRFGK